MVKVQIDISDSLNKKIRLYTVNKDYTNKEDAIVNLLEETLK